MKICNDNFSMAVACQKIKTLREQLAKILIKDDFSEWDIQKTKEWINRLVDKEQLNFSIHVLKHHPSTTWKKERERLMENVEKAKPAAYYSGSYAKNGAVQKQSLYIEKLKEPEDAYRIMCPVCEEEALIYLRYVKESDSAIGVCVKCKDIWVAKGIKGKTVIMKGE